MLFRSLDGANLQRANLDGANLDGANLQRANWPSDKPAPEGWEVVQPNCTCCLPTLRKAQEVSS